MAAYYTQSVDWVKTPVIGDRNYKTWVTDPIVAGEQMSRGRNEGSWGCGDGSYGLKFDELGIDLIPESEWKERIEERDRKKTDLCHICDREGLGVLNQNGTNYCWINAPTHCCEIVWIVQKQKLIRFSPASVGGPIKSYRNVGGWGSEGLHYIVENGIVPIEHWPANAIKKSYYNDTIEIRQRFKILEWIELKPKNLAQLVTVLLLGFPVACGFNWWGHETTAMRPVVTKSGAIGIEHDNSWGANWGNNGRTVLTGNKMMPDDAVSARVLVAA